MWRGVLLCVLLLCGIAFASPSAVAAREKGTEVVKPGEFWYYEMVVPVDMVVPLHASAEVAWGPPVNVFLLEDQEFDAFEKGREFRSYGGVQEVGTTDWDVKFEFLRSGHYYLVFDNHDYGAGGPAAGPSSIRHDIIYQFDPDPPRPVLPGETFVSPDQWYYESWEVTEGLGSVVLSVDLRVSTGSPVNVYLVDDENFDRSQRDEVFAAYRGYQFQGVREFSEYLEINKAGDYFLLIDNQVRPDLLAMKGSIITVATGSESGSTPAPGFLVFFLGLVGVGLARRVQSAS